MFGARVRARNTVRGYDQIRLIPSGSSKGWTAASLAGTDAPRPSDEDRSARKVRPPTGVQLRTPSERSLSRAVTYCQTDEGKKGEPRLKKTRRTTTIIINWPNRDQLIN
ncbi:hypothetical protein BHE90_017473 [Fusarium euwallaceae]|uniref:Uncharacterized protein n=1 Tax=Fusarium euwallaceae TaxID=1147111 RepID=A0A430KXD1_9HYPO|nr:hypothetical protein BHE90_017473 [Fusarium euwallaceae]